MIYRRETTHSATFVCDICEGLEARGCQIVSIIKDGEGTMYEIFYKEQD